jgi:alpha-glucosidase
MVGRIVKTNIEKAVILCLLFLAPAILGARDSKFTRKGVGPQYWTAYEYCYDRNLPMTELRWQCNIDWMANTFLDYGYDMICNDGWIEAAQTINENGFITKYNSNWNHGFAYWNSYIRSKGMKVGIYYNPLWMTKAAYEQNCKVIGTSKTTKEIVGSHLFNEALYWVDVDKPGAEQWVKGYVRYFKTLGVKYLRIDFLENYENNYGTVKYAKALQWIKEEAGDDLFLSLVMPNCYNHGKTEIKYGDMIRVSDDCFNGEWDFVSSRRRGQVKNGWPQYANVFDGMIAFSDIAAKGQLILDGDFMRLNKLENLDEKRFLFSLMIMGGSALAIADQYDTIDEDAMQVYRNQELLSLHNSGFSAKPLSRDIHNVNSSIWIGQLPDGDFVVGLFNREEESVTYDIDFFKDLGIDEGKVKNVRDLWSHRDLGSMKGKYEVTLNPHCCSIVRIHPSGVHRYQAECASLIKGR